MAKRKPRKLELPWNGDHGTGTAAANAGTALEPLEGSNPNRFARRVRRPQSDRWKSELSTRQYQAALAIEEAYCRVQMLSSGGELKEQVDATPKPDATIAAQVDATSQLARVMKRIPQSIRPVIEHLFWHNRALSQFVQGKAFYNRRAEVKVALDLVANELRY